MSKKSKINFSWVNPKLRVGKTKYGKGVFAKENIKKGETVAIFGGYIIHITNAEQFNNMPIVVQEFSHDIADGFLLSSIKNSELTTADYFNHSCSPNAGFKGQIVLVAVRNIKKGKEITFDYAMCTINNQKMKWYWEVECLCGSKKCRKIITGDDWKIKELQKRYNGYFQPYIQEKIDKIKAGSSL